MPRRRLPLSIALLVVLALAGSLALVGCDSNGDSENVRGEKAMDVVDLSHPLIRGFAIAASPHGDVALLWEPYSTDRLQLKELPGTSWHWSEEETVVSAEKESTSRSGSETALELSPEGGIAVGYDGLGRLLVAWAVDLGLGPQGKRWGIKARLRDATGNWQQERLVVRLPEKESGGAASLNLELTGGKRSIALSWSAGSAVSDRPSPDLSGFRILQGDEWLPLVYIRQGVPVVTFPDKSAPMVMWIREDGQIVHSFMRDDGSLDEQHVLAKADGFLTAVSSGNYTVAAWIYNFHTWASVWNGDRWSRPKRLGENGEDGGSHPIAVAITAKQSAVTWIGTPNSRGLYALEQHGRNLYGNWTHPRPLVPESRACDVGAGVSVLGEFVLFGSECSGSELEIAHVSASNRAEYDVLPFDGHFRLQAFASNSGHTGAHAFAWELDSGPESNPKPHLHVWVYRP